jgi:hypothetical protein
VDDVPIRNPILFYKKKIVNPFADKNKSICGDFARQRPLGVKAMLLFLYLLLVVYYFCVRTLTSLPSLEERK